VSQVTWEYDDRLTISTPEGVELTLTLAGVGSRFVAALVDGAIQWGLIGAAGVVLFMTDGLGVGSNAAAAIFALVVFVVLFGYDVAFEVLASGRTPGKRWNGLRVVRVGGQPIGFVASAIRNLLRVVDLLPAAYLVGITSILVTRKNQRLGDIVAGTVVVRERRAASQAPGTLARPASPAPETLATWDTSAITSVELGAVRDFLDRRGEIAPEARRSVATTLEARLRPKVAGVPDDVQGERFLEVLAAVKSSRG
jgi:uncharacterized RDD family membrane protein YckC